MNIPGWSAVGASVLLLALAPAGRLGTPSRASVTSALEWTSRARSRHPGAPVPHVGGDPLLFWTRASTVGGVQLVWRQGEGRRRGYELLVGSDPRRAPLKINRWGWAREGDETGSVMLGLMRADHRGVGRRGAHSTGQRGKRFVFKVIRTRVASGEAAPIHHHVHGQGLHVSRPRRAVAAAGDDAGQSTREERAPPRGHAPGVPVRPRRHSRDRGRRAARAGGPGSCRRVARSPLPSTPRSTTSRCGRRSTCRARPTVAAASTGSCAWTSRASSRRPGRATASPSYAGPTAPGRGGDW